MLYRIEMQHLAGRYVVALKSLKTGDLLKVFSVNASAAEILRLFQDGMEIPTIAQTLSEKYGVPMARILSDTESLLDMLR